MASALPYLLLIATYLIGSIPFSFVVVKLAAGADIRYHGSRNVGATNVARTFGKVPGLIALALDIAKGYAAVALAAWIVQRPDWPFIAGSAHTPALYSTSLWVSLGALIAVLAHMFPLWLRFHGGKGVATATGAFLALDPIAVAAGVLVFLIVILATRFVSLASILSASSIPIFLRFLVHAPVWTIVISIAIAFAIILKHHSNIARLAQGTERRMGKRDEQ
jgi:acyl phosphate:glycerol-3-phosphate acyltransferase